MSILLSSECETSLNCPISTLALVSSELWRLFSVRAFFHVVDVHVVMLVRSRIGHCGVSWPRSFFGIIRKEIPLAIGDEIEFVELWLSSVGL